MWNPYEPIDPKNTPPTFAELTKSLATNTTVTPPRKTQRTMNESQYTIDSAYSYIAFKNQDPNTESDLHIARRNFENKYQKFLMIFGQYSNSALDKPSPDGSVTPILYPITNDTDIFKSFPWLKPTEN